MLSTITNYFKQLDVVNSGYDQTKLTAMLIVLWTYLFFIVQYTFKFPKLSKPKQNDTKNRVVSIVHGLLTLYLSTYCLFLSSQGDIKYPPLSLSSPNTPLRNWLVITSLSYIIYDLVACYYYDLFDWGLLIHHGLCILGYLSALCGDYGSIVAIAGLFYAEVSNLPMHSRMIAKNFGLRYSKVYEYSEGMYLVTYIISRGVFCPVNLLYPALRSETCPIGVKFICFMILVQSAHYILQMWGILKKKMREHREMRAKGVEYNWFSVAEGIEKLSFVKTEEKQKIF